MKKSFRKYLSIALSLLLIIGTVFAVPVGAEETEAKTYFYHFNDYETITNEDSWLLSTRDTVDLSVETTSPLSGSQSLNATSVARSSDDYVGIALSNAVVPAGSTVRVTFDYKVTVGSAQWGKIGFIGWSNDLYNWSNIHSNSFTEASASFAGSASVMSTAKTATCVITKKSTAGTVPLGVDWSDGKAASTVLFDNLKIAEIIDTVAATSADEAKGTVAVQNKAGYDNYAVNEVAVFTATPADGYAFAGWYNGDTLVSESATYEHTLTTDITLTAKWKIAKKEYQYITCNYDNLTDTDEWFSKSDYYTVSVETDNPISGTGSLKLTGTTNDKYGGISVFPYGTTLKSGKYYRVSAKTKVLEGTFNFGRIGNIGFNASGGFNWSHIHIQSGYTGSSDNGGTPLDLWKWSDMTSSSATLSKKGTIKISENVQYNHLGVAYHIKAVDTTSSKASVLLDDVVAAEIIDSVTAVSDNDTMGTATVTNKDGYENYAVNETAVYTATPANGYYFVGWYNEDGELVSNSETYETVVTTDLTLTAKFNEVANLIQISFVSNGGSDVETVNGGAGVKVNMPANPTKEGYTFAGWYTDEDCTDIYPCKVFPEKDTTLYAKWITGVYQDFENFTTATYNPSNATILEDADYSYGGTHAFKATVNNGVAHRVIVAQKETEKLSAFANAGDKVTISFKYKLVSGSVNFYPHTATVTNNVNALASCTTSTGSTGYANGYVYYGTNLTNTSNEWQTFTHTYTLNSQSYFDGIGVDSAKALGYTLLFFTAKSDNTEIYVDDVMVYKTVDIPINYSTEAVRLEPTNSAKPLTAAIQGDTVSFKAVCDDSVTPTVTYGDTTITPQNGVYTIVVTESDELTVTAAGISDAQNHAPGVGLSGEDLTKYDDDVFMQNIWEGDTVYHEAVMFANTSDGVDQTTKTLLYPVDDVISIRNAGLNVWYVKGVDYDIENGKLVWLNGGKMPIYTGAYTVLQSAEDENYDDAMIDNGSLSYAQSFPTDDENGLYLMWDGYHERHTVYVTYTHSKTWEEYDGTDGYTPAVPENQSYDMGNFYNKLATDEDVNVLVYGDSTATGCSSTGANMSYELFGADGTVTERGSGSSIKAPTFFEQATAKLVKKYGNDNNINYYNIALGGKNAAWGAENLKTRVGYMNDYYDTTVTPDIIYVKFCANDTTASVDSYKESMSSIVTQFKTLYPNAAIVLVSGKINNENSSVFSENHNKFLAFENALAEIADANTSCIVVKNTSVWAEIVESKDYEDYLSNNINHANDFWAKTTAQIIVATAEKNSNVTAVKTAYNNSAAIRTAAASSTGKNGLRIYNEIKTEWINSANIVEYGSVAMRTARLNGDEVTLDNGVKGIAYSDGTHSTAKSAVLWETKDGAYVFTSYLTNIAEKYYGDSYSIRSYAIDESGKVYYGETVEISVFDVANAIDNGNSASGTAPSDTDKDAFYTFVTESNYTEYKDWCTAQSKVVGSLFEDKYQ